MISRRHLAALAAAGLPSLAVAQSYPTRPIKMILPFPAGSATDSAARFVAGELRKNLGQAVVVENQVGADGLIATQNAKRSPADGYTILVSTNSGHGVNSAIFRELPYDPIKDFDPIGGLMRNPMMIMVARNFPADDFAGFMAIARERSASRPLTYGSGNTSGRVLGELLKATARVDMLNVPYRGTPQVIQDLVGGQIDVGCLDPVSAVGMIASGDIKVLAVADAMRTPALPNVPTMAQVGLPGVEVVSWAAFFVPSGTDTAIVDRLNREINAILRSPQTDQFITTLGATPMPMTPAQLRTFVAAEIPHWARLVEIAGIERNR
ncbi:Bug family tripartite tricarboxylate transporter substrate binding protein [Humitalea sp. 24SJ18S-53]|uniref:Bug family tripartite tricarboxylate transporter substrate binding protein n=1 Tax=Humitalea sp. 24SJ18S-53 TaxID=3422307 RepID=UPI003D673391